MPSLRTPVTHRSIALVVSFMIPLPVEAQQLSAQTSVALSVRVQPTLAIHGVVARAVRRDRAGRVTATSVIEVESNLPYRVSVRSAPATGAHILVRNASGALEPLTPGRSVTVAVSHAGGRRSHEVVCQLQAAEPDALDVDACPLVYDVSADYQDSLIKATADFGLRTRTVGTPLLR